MASSFFALFDDIATLLDDVAAMTKVAAKKTAGVLGDDLALNANQVAGVNADRELPVVWAVAKGSFINKLILVPFALLINFFAPWLITPMLLIGGAYLCFEGVEKLVHTYLHKKQADAEHHAHASAVLNEKVDLLNFEKEKIKGAIRTDFILSAEIIVIALGTVQTLPFMQKAIVLSLVSVLMTMGVYGLVALIVKLDDMGLHLIRERQDALNQTLGRILIQTAPWLMKALSVLGTLAMFLVGGGIITHNWPWLHHGIEHLTQQMQVLSGLPQLSQIVLPTLADFLIGLLLGFIVLLGVQLVQKFSKK